MKKTLAILVAILMIVGTMPIAFAAEGETRTIYVKEEFTGFVFGNGYEYWFADEDGNELECTNEYLGDDLYKYTVPVSAAKYYMREGIGGGVGDWFTYEPIPEKVDTLINRDGAGEWYCSHQMETSGAQTCQGQICQICGENYGEASDHSYGEDDICIYCGDFLVLDGAPSTQTIDGKTFYELDSAADLYWFAEQVNVYGNKGINGILTADIVLNKDLMSKITIAEDGTATVKDGKTVRSWTPICKYINSDRNGYSGIFDGANHTVSGAYVNDSNGDYISFFGMIEGATIKNFGITDSYFRAKYKCASFSGNAYSATIINCFSEDCFVSGSYKVGGLIAYLYNSTLTGCYNASEVRCSGGSDAGGLTGEVVGKSIIRDCFNTGDVYGKGTVYVTGGISGISNNRDVIVENCYNIGKINGEDKEGGILGKNYGTAINCYNHTGFFAGNAIGYSDDKAVEISVEGKNAQQFASGEVTYALGSAWGQKLGEDLYPVLGSADKVYRISEYETCGQTDEPVVEYTNEGDSDVNYAPSHDLYGETICLGQLCSVCGKYGGTPDNDKHSMIWKTAKEATCYDEGLKISYCEFCGMEPAVSTVLCDESTYPESEHNYSANLDKEFIFSNENTIKLTLKFSEMTQTEKNADFIYIYDGKGNQLGKYSGKELSEKEFEIEGGSFKIKLTSDHGLQYYGFKLDYVYATVADIDSEYAEEIPIVGHSFADGKCGVCGYICPHNDMDVHYCNICGKTLECYDNDDHKCDYCGETLSECQDADNHKCDICQVVLSECADEDNDHACDICSIALSSCTDSDDDHVCDFCGEYSSDCSDSNDDERCDLCGAEAVTAVVKLYDSYGDGWNGSGISVVRGDNVSRVISFDDGSSYEETFKLFRIGYSLKWKRGGYPGECSFEIIIDGVTVVTASEGSYTDVADGYEILNTASLCEHKSEDGNHECDGCAKVLDCADENKDHICDFGNEELACADNDKNHFCDFGGEELSQCADEDDNHNCDICDAVLTGYTDADKNHECDICGEITVCIDEDADSFCDICEKYLEDEKRVELEYVDDYAYPNDYYNAFDGEEPENLFDEDNTSKICIKFGNSKFSNGCDYYAVEFKTADDSEIYVSKYDFVTGNDAPERDPKSWKLYGSDDGESWTLIDERTDENITQSRNETVSYDVASGGKTYSYFKLEIHMVRQEYFFDEYGSFDDIPNAIFQLSEIALYKTHPHSWADGKCEICRIECEHKSNTDNICDTCGKSLHTCDFSGEWFYDSEKHWKKCECSLVDVEAAHSYTEGVCDVCGYECTHAEQTGAECEICGKILHTHNYEYTASGNTITATCTASGTCDAPDGGYLKLVVPTKYSWKQYSATAKEIEVENTIADISYEVDYCCDGGCINAGSHTASVTLGGATATVGFEIEKYYVSQASLIMSTRTKVYDGTTDAPGEINALKFYMATGSEIINLPADGYQATVRYETPEVGDRKVIWQWVKVTDKEAMKNYKFGYNDFENGLNSDFSITKRPITVTPEANEVLIGNQPNAGNKVIVGGDYGLADNQTITVTYQHIDSSAVGEKELIIDTVTILDANGNDVTSNYEITTVNGICDVVECPHETYTDGVCDICGYSCEHESYTEGVCDVCGYECPHEDTYNNLIRPVQNADGTWGKGKVVEICNICGNSSLVQEVERDHEGYKVFDETAAELEAILNSGKMTDTWKNDYTNRLNGLRNSAYYQVYTEIETAIPSMTESLKSIIAEIEAGIADGTMIKADFTYMTSLFDEINALIDNDPNKLIPSESGRFQGIYYGYYMSCKNDGNHSQADYDQNMAGNNWDGQIEAILAGVKDGSALKADYTAIDEAIVKLDEKLADKNLTDEAKAGLEEIKAQLEEKKADGNTSAADLAELEKALETYETELDAGIEDGSAIKVDGLEEIVKINDALNNELTEKYGEEALTEIVEKIDEKFADKFDELYERAEALTGTVAENKEALAEIEAEMKAVFAEIENCLNGTHNGLDYVVIEEAKCEANAVESATCTICGEVLTREVENSAIEHIFLEYKSNDDATCEADGTKTAECVFCGETDTVTDEGTKFGHTDEDGDKICDECEEEIVDVCPDCGGPVHEGEYGQYICALRILIKLLVALIQFLATMA